MKKLLPLLAATGLIPSGFVGAQGPGTGFTFYSDICLHRETGDLLGTRIGVMKLRDATYIFYQIAEGEFEQPQIIKLTKDGLAGSKLSFPVADPDRPSTFVGTIGERAIEGHFTNGAVGPKGTGTYDLGRVELPEANFPACR